MKFPNAGFGGSNLNIPFQKKGALTKKGKKVAANPLSTKKVEAKKTVNPLFEKRPRNFRIGEQCLQD